MNDKWEFYKDGSDKWRWRRKASNGNIVGGFQSVMSTRLTV
jgi:uncharacterized protein YegP (UPF0339 family)